MFVINESEKTLIDKLIVYRDDNFFKRMDFGNYLLYVDTPRGLPISHNDENVRIYLLNLKGYRVWYPMKELYLQAESLSSIFGRVSTFNKYEINYEHYEDNELKDFGFTDIDSIVEAGKRLRYDIIVFEKMPNEYVKNSIMNIYVVNKDSKAISNIHEDVKECLKLKKQTNESFEPLLNAESEDDENDIFISENIYDVVNAIKNQMWDEMKFILDDKANIYILLDPFYLTHFEAFDTVWDSKLYYDTSLNYDLYVSNNFNKSLNFIKVITTCEGKPSGELGEDSFAFEYIYDNFNILSRVDISNIPLMKILGKANEVLTSKNNIKEEASLTITDNYLEEKIIKKGNKYQVQSEKGKNLGTYNTRKEAEDRLKQIHYFKHINKDNLDESKQDLLDTLYSSKEPSYGSCYLLDDGTFLFPSEKDNKSALAFHGDEEDIIDTKFGIFKGYDLKHELYHDYNAIVLNSRKQECRMNFSMVDSKPTEAQYNAILNWLDFIQEEGNDRVEFEDYRNGTAKIFNYYLSKSISDDILKSIKRYFSTGVLAESNEFSLDYDKKRIKESILDYEKAKIYYVTSDYEAKYIVLNSTETMRVWIDKTKQIYLIGNSYETTHGEMVEEARKEGIDVVFDDFDKNQICILYVPQEDKDFDVYGDAIVDDYDTEYAYKNGVRVYSRYNDFSQFKLCSLLGEYTKHKLIKEGYTTPTKMYDITNDTAEFSKEGADWVWWDSEAKHSENYANAYRVKISPEDYLDLTTREGAYGLSKGMSIGGTELRDLDIKEFNKETYQPIWLKVEFTNTTSPYTADVIGHEGRHRMFALWQAGVKKVDIQIRVHSNENYDKYNPHKIGRITLTSQFVPSRKVTISGLVPMSWAEHKKIRPDLEQVTEGFEVNQFRLGTAGYILEDGSFYEVDEYHGEDSEYRNEGLPEYSNTVPEEDTCVRIYKEPNDKQYEKLEEIIDKYLDTEGYCKVELWNSPLGEYYFYKVYSLYEGACQYETFDEVVGNWTGYKLVQIIKNNIKRNAWDKSIGESLSTKQEDYFKNSKIRDSEGNLIPVYHGSKETDIKVFDPRQGKSQFGQYKFGNAVVNYFTKDKEVAVGYTELGKEDDNIYEVYLNIENPYIVNNETVSDIKSHSNIKDKTIRNKQLDYFNKVWNKWNNKQISEEDLEKLNSDLFYLGFEVKSSLDREEDNQAYGTDEEWYDLYKLDQNTKFGKKHIVEYSYSLEELFSDDMYDTMKEDIVGIDEEDYYFTTDDIVKMVLLMNEEDNTNYDGIIIPDISDIGPTGSLFSNITTDYVTLKSSNQIKAVSNLNPTSSNRIDEKVEDIKTYPSETKYLSVKDEIIPIGEYLYHATSKENYDNILKDGYIKVGMDSNWGIHSKSDSIYLAIDRDTAIEYANRAELEEVEILEISVSSLDLTKLYIDSNEEYYYIDGEGYDVYSFEYKDNINITNNLKEKVIDISNTDRYNNSGDKGMKEKEQKTSIITEADGSTYEINVFDDNDIGEAFKELEHGEFSTYDSIEEMWKDLGVDICEK